MRSYGWSVSWGKQPEMACKSDYRAIHSDACDWYESRLAVFTRQVAEKSLTLAYICKDGRIRHTHTSAFHNRQKVYEAPKNKDGTWKNLQDFLQISTEEQQRHPLALIPPPRVSKCSQTVCCCGNKLYREGKHYNNNRHSHIFLDIFFSFRDKCI